MKKIVFDKKFRTEFLLKYRLIVPIKNSNHVIDDEIAGYLRGTFERIGKSYKVKLLSFEYQSNYIIATFKTEPQIVLSKFVNAYKTSSSRQVKKNYPDVIQKLDQETFWDNSYLLVTEGSNLEQDISLYLEQKGVKKDESKK